jgi:DNA invertase Pin-like site-specific DNA recombinase
MATKKVHQMDNVSDAHKLSSGYPKEEIYADYANHLKALANRARKEYLVTERPRVNKEAAIRYAEEVASLKRKLTDAELNAPRERQANLLAGARAQAKKEANPDMTKSEYKKLKQQEIARARVEVGSDGKATRIKVTPKEWEAIQHGAISSTQLERILNHSDPDTLRQLATPRDTKTLSMAKINKIRTMSNDSNYTLAEIAKALGVSTSTVSKVLNGTGD